MSRPGAVVFDLDGTLIDSAPDLLAATNALLQETDRRPLVAAEIIPMIGDGIPALISRAFAATGTTSRPDVPPDALSRFLEIYLDPRRPQLTRVYPDVPGTLRELRQAGYLLAVCTNKIEQAALQLLDQLHLSHLFDTVVGGDAVPAKKPDPAHVQAALGRLNVPAPRAVTVGDSRNDVAAGLKAGTSVVAVSYGYGEVWTLCPRPTRIIDAFRELPEVLAELLPGAATPGGERHPPSNRP